MVLVKNDQRKRKGWPTTSWDVSLDCRRNFSKVRVLRHYVTSVYPQH